MLCNICGTVVALKDIHIHPYKGKDRVFCTKCDPNVVKLARLTMWGSSILLLDGMEKKTLVDWEAPKHIRKPWKE